MLSIVSDVGGLISDNLKSVGCIGGWAQGGGHSPANHYGGLGADQILEAQVVMVSPLAISPLLSFC
jgi:hypothetical protein